MTIVGITFWSGGDSETSHTLSLPIELRSIIAFAEEIESGKSFGSDFGLFRFSKMELESLRDTIINQHGGKLEMIYCSSDFDWFRLNDGKLLKLSKDQEKALRRIDEAGKQGISSRALLDAGWARHKYPNVFDIFRRSQAGRLIWKHLDKLGDPTDMRRSIYRLGSTIHKTSETQLP